MKCPCIHKMSTYYRMKWCVSQLCISFVQFILGPAFAILVGGNLKLGRQKWK